ncbi:hypothetical protein [Flammeovirga sp. SubArs3]|uniref:hypothetical protein n=1 Tax=Flammeovirga sp. SubArs3 TaxID=2995316 RepID=UPI00248AE6C1|nr:hypothetical protein [Flammeovirga sp. SubArs3]
MYSISRTNKHLPTIIGLIILYIILGSVFHELFFYPNSYLLSTENDALKNYFLYAWIVQFGPELNLNAFNFPFGEAILFTDSIPIISSCLYYLGCPPINSIGILHYLLIISYGIGYYYTYRILISFKVNLFYSSFFSVIIILSNPITSRVSLHFGLFFLIALLPYTIFLLTQNKNNLLKLFCLLFFSYFIHSYTGFFLSIVTLLYLILTSIKRRVFNFNLIYLLLPTIFYLSLLKITDDHLWRSSHPLLLFDFNLSIRQILLPFYDQKYHTYYQANFNYWFWLTVIIICFNLFYLKTIRKIPSKILIISILGFGILVYGTGVLLRFEFIIRTIPYLEQVRSLERFSWLSNFTLSICCIYLICLSSSRYLIYIIIGIGTIESIYYQIDIRNDLTITSNPYNSRIKLNDIPNDISCVIPVFGNFTDDKKVIKDSYKLAYYTQKPTTHNYLSRLSDEERFINKQFHRFSLEENRSNINKYFKRNSKVLLHGDSINLQEIGDRINGKSIEINGTKALIVNIDYFLNKKVYFDDLKKTALSYQDDSVFISYSGNQLIKQMSVDSLQLKKEYSLLFWNYHYHQDSLKLNRVSVYQNSNPITQKKYLINYSILSNKWGATKLDFKLNSRRPISLSLDIENKEYIYFYDIVNHITPEQRRRKQKLFFKDFMIFNKHSLDSLLNKHGDIFF